MIDYNILSTGSQGNAVIINKFILIDCGVSLKLLKPYIKDLKIVLLTHIHSDHFNKSTIHLLAQNRPTLRFGCCSWLARDLLSCGVNKANIDIYNCNVTYSYGFFKVIPIKLSHNVPNCGYKIHFRDLTKLIYATDTNNLNGIEAKDYDLYMIEANYEDEIISEKIRQKKEAGEYAYEMQVLKNHLSKKKCDNFIYSNIGQNGIYIYMHCHKEESSNETI